MDDNEAQALNEALAAIETLSWHGEGDENDGAELGEEELFSKADRERMRL